MARVLVEAQIDDGRGTGIKTLKAFGDLRHNTQRPVESPNGFRDIDVTYELSFVVPGSLGLSLFNIRRVYINGVGWTIKSVRYERPRAILSVGKPTGVRL